MDDSQASTSGRSRRQKVDKTGRLSALEKLKEARSGGGKRKYEIGELENVYDEVDEKEYSNTVLKRQRDDWIVDDGESGYIEDGREVFDDDLDEESIQEVRKQRPNMTGPRKRRKEDDKEKGDIQSMIRNMSSKKDANVTQIKDDDILGELLSEISTSKKTTNSPKPGGSKNKFCHTIHSNITQTYQSSSINLKPVDKVISEKPQEIVLESVEQNASQIIEEENSPTVDLSECVGDLSTIDFDDGSMDMDFSSSAKNIKSQKNVIDVQKAACKTSVKSMKIGNAVDLTEVAPQLVKTKDAEKEEEVFRFYYLDAYENPYKNPGTVYLFGKTYVSSYDTYCSCCVMVNSIPRRIYVLPRKYIKNTESQLTTMEDVYKEFDEYANKLHMTEFKLKEVKKHYAFEKEGTPKTSDYLEIRYNARYPAIDSNYSGLAIERVFGTTVNALELLLIERKIKGPCWLDIKNISPTAGRVAWCPQIVVTSDMDNISLCSQEKPKPPMVIATLNVRMSLNAKLQNEVVMVAVLINHKYNVDKEPPKPPYDRQFCFVTHPRDTPWPRQIRDAFLKVPNTEVIKCETESELLEELLTLMQKADPDLIIGYDCAFQFDVLMQRMLTLKVSNWNRMGRLKSTTPPLLRGKIILNQAFVGRPICDIQVSAKELNLKVRSYDLQSLCSAVLKTKEHECKEITPAETPSFFNTADKVLNLMHVTLKEAKYIMTIVMDLNVISLALQIICLAGNILSRTLLDGRAERNEYLLLHAFNLKDYITLDKKIEKKGRGDGKKLRRMLEASYLIRRKVSMTSWDC